MSIIAAKAQTDSEEVSDDMIEKIKTGGFKIGADVGFPLSGTTDISNFNFGFYGTYLVEVAENLEVGGLVGYTHFSGDGYYERYLPNNGGSNGTSIRIDNDSNSFLPIAASARYHFMDHAFFAALDLGFALNVSGDADTGMYFRPKFGYNLGMINLLASFQVITAEVDHSAQGYFYNVNGFNSFNIGIEYSF
ncbi:hypothetical protein BKM32_09995 [Mangrovimonas sp. DI 80]|nr:hypothetical protein BKM32_09995 [Mangrovimonas sp. DI 80]